jgi:hypothetical protein
MKESFAYSIPASEGKPPLYVAAHPAGRAVPNAAGAEGRRHHPVGVGNAEIGVMIREEGAAPALNMYRPVPAPIQKPEDPPAFPGPNLGRGRPGFSGNAQVGNAQV